MTKNRKTLKTEKIENRPVQP